MKRLMAVLAILAMAACTDQATAPEQQQAPAVSADFMNNPDNGNPRIYRFADAYAFCYTDVSNGLRVCLATVPLGGGTEPDCGLQSEADSVSIQWILGKDDVRQNLVGDVWVTIRDLSQPGACFNVSLVAEGWGRIHQTDNDVFGAGPGEHNANAWGFMWQGRGTTPTGGNATFSGHARWVYSNTFGLRPVVFASVRVRY